MDYDDYQDYQDYQDQDYQVDYQDYQDTDYVDEETLDRLCYYCGNKCIKELIKCCNSDCGQYFCNNTTDQFGSHIFIHMDLRRHNMISLPNDFEIFCEICKETNCFALCFNLDREGGITLICRTKCLIDKQEFRGLEWKGILFEKMIENTLIRSVSAGKSITYDEILKLEGELSRGEMKNLLDIGPDSYRKISLRYSRYEEYKDTYERLLELEHEYDKYYSSIEGSQQIIPNWESNFKRFSYCLTEERCHVKEKDEVCVLGKEFKATGCIKSVTNQGLIVVELINKKLGSRSLTNLVVKPVYNDIAYDRMKRGLKMFKKVDISLVNIILGYPVAMNELPDPEIDDFSIEGLPALNESQNIAVKKALISKISLIQGPPGTGKTVTTATIVYHLSKMINRPNQYEITKEKVDSYQESIEKIFHDMLLIDKEKRLREALRQSLLDNCEDKQSKDFQSLSLKLHDYVEEMSILYLQKSDLYDKQSKMFSESSYKLSTLQPDTSRKLILVCAPSNVAVDHLVEKISSTSLKVLRIYSKAREELDSTNSASNYLKVFERYLCRPEFSELRVLHTAKKASGLDKAQLGKYRRLEMELRDRIIKDFEVICCTCIGSLDPRLAGLRFEKVVIDEACQAQEPETLLPLLTRPEQIIMVGDHFQLGPIIKCKEAEKAGLENSLFRRLIDLGFESYMLSIQYRMHPAIASFPSFTFYNDLLKNGVDNMQRTDYGSNFRWPGSAPLFFYHIDAQEEHSSTGKSYVNQSEALAVVEIVKRLGARADIGIITFYDAQRVVITKYANSESINNIEIASVDSFQGREKDYIILSCVRSNISAGVGFLGNYRRLNVAITRAKYGLIICGNARTLSKSPVWSKLLDFYQNNGLIFTGELNSLNRYYIEVRQKEFYTFDSVFPYAERKQID